MSNFLRESSHKRQIKYVEAVCQAPDERLYCEVGKNASDITLESEYCGTHTLWFVKVEQDGGTRLLPLPHAVSEIGFFEEEVK